MATGSTSVSQYQKPRGWLGRYTLWRMNLSHSKLTDWGLGHLSVGERDMILDVGCGGGKTVSKLAATATEGRIYGVDFSEESVAVSKENQCGLDRSGPCRNSPSLRVTVAVSRRHVRPRHRRLKRTSGGLTCPGTRAKSSAS